MADYRQASGSQQQADCPSSQSQYRPSIDESSDGGGWSPHSRRSTFVYPDNMTSPTSVASTTTVKAMTSSPQRPIIQISEGEKMEFPSMDMLDKIEFPSMDWNASSPIAVSPPLPQERHAINMHAASQIAEHSHGSEQLSHMRYTAATCAPDGFAASRYSLRSYRQTELLVVVTMSDEDEGLFLKTMKAVIDNIAYLCMSKKPWNHNAWQKVVVCIVSDGRSTINPRTLHVLQLMGCYQSGTAKPRAGDQDVTAHIFEYTSSTIVSETYEVAKGATPVQIIFCLKEQNTGKLDSHRWALKAFGPSVKPKVCLLLDVGTTPMKESFYEFWQCFRSNPLVGGACGEIAVESGRWGFSLLESPLAAFQNVQQTTSNIFDKPLESVFGYISAMPSGFSAYRYEALLGEPLAGYFNSELEKRTETDSDDPKAPTLAELLRQNMHLSEDRILSFEIVTKKDKPWILKYLKTARASTAVPTTTPEFIAQRRSWLNGSLFATINAIVFQYRIWTSAQDWFRKIVLQLEFLYKTAQALFAWTSLANFYLAFYFLLRSATTDANRDAFSWLGHGAGETVFNVFNKIYIGLLLVVLVCSLGNRLQGSRLIYGVVAALFGICTIIALWSAGFSVRAAVQRWQSEKESISNLFLLDGTLRDIALPFAVTCLLYLVTLFLHEDPWPMFCSAIQYIFLLPSYVNILVPFTMCNFNDIGREATGDNTLETVVVEHASNDNENANSAWEASLKELRQPAPVSVARDGVTKRANHARNLRTNVVLAWMCTNLIMMVFFTSDTYLSVSEERSAGGLFNPYLAFLCYALLLSSLIHFLGSSLYLSLLLYDVWIYRKGNLINDTEEQLGSTQRPQEQEVKPKPKSSSFPATRFDPRAPKASGLSVLRRGFRRSRAQGSVRAAPGHTPPAAGSAEKL